jgi:hypothetical protein
MVFCAEKDVISAEILVLVDKIKFDYSGGGALLICDVKYSNTSSTSSEFEGEWGNGEWKSIFHLSPERGEGEYNLNLRGLVNQILTVKVLLYYSITVYYCSTVSIKKHLFSRGKELFRAFFYLGGSTNCNPRIMSMTTPSFIIFIFPPSYNFFEFHFTTSLVTISHISIIDDVRYSTVLAYVYCIE